MTAMDIEFTVNGNVEHVRTEPTQTLLTVLREGLGLTGTKDGCSSGDCGACVVLLDDQPMNACMVLAGQVEGSEVVTVEGLAADTGAQAIQEAFGRTWAFQCGFCTPGMLVSCSALLQSNANPSREEILNAVAGNFCRCTAYQNVVKAVQEVASEMRSAPAAGEST